MRQAQDTVEACQSKMSTPSPCWQCQCLKKNKATKMAPRFRPSWWARTNCWGGSKQMNWGMRTRYSPSADYKQGGEGIIFPSNREDPNYWQGAVHKGILGGSDSQESACSAGDLDLIPGLGRSPGGGDVATHPVFLPGEFPWTEEPGRLQSMGSQRVRHDWATKHSTRNSSF